jgi:hypothetical protein
MERIALNDQAMAAIKQQLEAFEKKFGRPPGPDDPIFFDPDADTPQEISQEKLDTLMEESMRAAGIGPAKIYAYKKTGFLASTKNWNLLSRSRQAQWNAAIREYEERESDCC